MSALIKGCSTLPENTDRSISTALTDYQRTRLGQLSARANPNPALSGFRLLLNGTEAYSTLIALADAAERTLDLQYYLIQKDESARAILQRVRAAAERGVRVRILLDDLNTAGEDDSLLVLAAHPNIEVRLYNPFPTGRFSMVTRVISSLGDAARAHRRMHNKMFVADNALAVTGGRNIGNAYFLHSADSNFVDFDVLTAGPTVRALSMQFDHFWDDRLSFPIHTVVAPPQPSSDHASVKQASSAAALTSAMSIPAAPANAPRTTSTDSTLASELASGKLNLTWVPAVVVADKPSKISDEDKPDEIETVAENILGLLASAKKEAILISPYFVPGKDGVALAAALQQRGVHLRVLTNSLAATDAPAVHIGYARYRTELLKLGVEIHELKPRASVQDAKAGVFSSSRSSLHAKAVVIDRRTLLIGSMNLDPRSALYNTEIGIVIRSKQLSNQVAQVFEAIAQRDSYLLTLDSASSTDDAVANGHPDGRLTWTDPSVQPPLRQYTEPESSLWLNFTLKLLSPFAPEDML